MAIYCVETKVTLDFDPKNFNRGASSHLSAFFCQLNKRIKFMSNHLGKSGVNFKRGIFDKKNYHRNLRIE